MASKTQHHKQLFTEEEKNSVPFVRALYKKIRNISKKLSDIKELEQKNLSSLKPEQREKLSKKESLIEETAKYENVLKIYKQTMEGQKKDQSQTDRIVNLLIIGRYLHKAKNLDKKLANIEQIQALKSIYEEIINENDHLNNKEKLLNLQSHLKTYLKNDFANTVVQKIVNNKQFLNASLPVEPKHTFQQTKIQQIKKIFDVPATDNSKQLDQTIVKVEQNSQTHKKSIILTDIKVEGNHININIQKINVDQPKNTQTKPEQSNTTQPNPPTSTENPPQQENPSTKQNNNGQKQTQNKQQTQNKNVDKKRYNKYGNYRGKNHQNRSHHRKSEEQAPTDALDQDPNRFTKEQKAQLVNDGFIIIEPKKQAPKTNYKRFGPNRDNRQYHQ